MAYEDPGSGSSQDGSTVDVAKEQAGRVGQTAASASADVARTTKEQAQNVVGEAKQQARDLVGEARTQAADQAGAQKGRAVQGLHSIGDELDQMAQQGGQSGMATEVAKQVSGRVRDLAEYLDRHEPAELLDEVRAYARRRPVVFLAGAAIAGVVAGRLTRGLASKDDSGPELSGGSPQALSGGLPPALPVAEPYGTGYPAATGTVEPGYAAPDYAAPGYVAPGSAAPDYAAPGYVAPGSAAPDYAAPGYAAPDYPAPDYPAQSQPPAYQPTPGYDGGYGQPDPAAYPPAPERGSADPGYVDEAPPTRGWTQ